MMEYKDKLAKEAYSQLASEIEMQLEEKNKEFEESEIRRLKEIIRQDIAVKMTGESDENSIKKTNHEEYDKQAKLKTEIETLKRQQEVLKNTMIIKGL